MIETIDYYIQVTSTDFAETKSPENQVKVVAGAQACSGTLAPIGAPIGAVSVLSASGSAAGSLAGFGGIAGGALGIAGIAAIVGGVLVGGVVVNQVSNDDPTPTPTSNAHHLHTDSHTRPDHDSGRPVFGEPRDQSQRPRRRLGSGGHRRSAEYSWIAGRACALLVPAKVLHGGGQL